MFCESFLFVIGKGEESGLHYKQLLKGIIYFSTYAKFSEKLLFLTP